jgi:hypothetical protein
MYFHFPYHVVQQHFKLFPGPFRGNRPDDFVAKVEQLATPTVQDLMSDLKGVGPHQVESRANAASSASPRIPRIRFVGIRNDPGNYFCGNIIVMKIASHRAPSSILSHLPPRQANSNRTRQLWAFHSGGNFGPAGSFEKYFSG